MKKSVSARCGITGCFQSLPEKRTDESETESETERGQRETLYFCRCEEQFAVDSLE